VNSFLENEFIIVFIFRDVFASIECDDELHHLNIEYDKVSKTKRSQGREKDT